MSKTAMQILLGQIDFAIKQRESTSAIVDTKAVLLLMKEQVTELLNKEKEQIIAAWNNRDEFYEHYNGESYYEQTYNQKPPQRVVEGL